jgi:hypothetical protein
MRPPYRPAPIALKIGADAHMVRRRNKSQNTIIFGLTGKLASAHKGDMESSAHISLQAIRAKKNELLSAAAKYDALADKARKEAADFEAAERVWFKMMPDLIESDGVVVEAPPGTGKSRAGRLLEALQRKPAGIPPVPEMIIEALTESAERGAPGLTPMGLLSFIQAKHWPEAQSGDVGSTAWRMWKDGRLSRPHEGFYGLPTAKNSPPEPREAEQEVMPG